MTLARDRYTRAVLTVIAGCLLLQCALLVGARVEAQQPVAPPMAQPVVIVGWGELLPNGQVRLAPPQTPLPVGIAAPQTLPVMLNPPPQPIPVAIASIQHGAGSWDSINTRIDPQGPAATPGYQKR